MYKLLIIMLHNVHKVKSEGYNGLCVLAIELISPSSDMKHCNNVRRYIKSRKTLSYLLRRFFGYILNLDIDYPYYWRQGWIFPRKWYLIRHIFYCWLWYWCNKPFKRK